MGIFGVNRTSSKQIHYSLLTDSSSLADSSFSTRNNLQLNLTRSYSALFLVMALFILTVSSVSKAQTALASNIQTYQQLTSQAPHDPNAWIGLGQAYIDLYKTNSFEDLLTLAYDSFWEAVRLDYKLFEGHFGLGIIEFERGNLEAALFAFDQLASLHPERFDGHYNRAVALVALEQADEAVDAFNNAIDEAEPEASIEELISAYSGLAGQLRVVEDFDQAVDAYTAAIELSQEKLGTVDPQLSFLRSQALVDAGRGVEALADLSELDKTSGDVKYSSLVADVYIQAGQIDYARRALQSAERQAAQAGDIEVRSDIIVKMGLLEASLGNKTAAQTAYQNATRVNSNSWQAFYQLGLMYLENGQTEFAYNTLQNARRIEPNSSEINLALASVSDQLNRSQEAQQYSEQALALLPDNSPYRYDADFILGRTAFRSGDYATAQELLSPLLDIDASNPELQLWMGLTSYQLEEFDDAVEYIERATFLNPESLEARVNLGAAYLAAERYQDSQLVYELLIEETGGDADTFYNLGWAFLLQEDAEQAKEVWEQSAATGYQPASEALSEYF